MPPSFTNFSILKAYNGFYFIGLYYMEESSDEKIITQSVKGINYVRQPTLQFNKLQETKDFIEYEIFTKKNNDIKEGNNPLTNYLNSFIFCNETITIKQPKKSFMVKKNGKKM